MPTYGFDEKGVKRVVGAVRWIERRYRNNPPAGPRAPILQNSVVPVKLPSGAIAAGSAASPSSGTGNFYKLNGAGPGLSVGDTVTLYNTFAIATPTGGKTGFAIAFGGRFYLVSWEC